MTRGGPRGGSGRKPRLDGRRTVSVSFDAPSISKLSAIASTAGASRSGIIRQLVAEAKLWDKPAPGEVGSIRASEADIVIQCGAAARPVKCAIDDAGEAAIIGQAAHDALETWMVSGMVGEPVAHLAAARYGIDPALIEEMVARGPEALATIAEDLTQAQAEIKVEGGGIRGRIDVLALVHDEGELLAASVLDWKTGRDPWASTKPTQRLAYASAIEANYGMPTSGFIYSGEIWLSTGDILESRFDLADIEGFRERLRDKISRSVANPGRHCRYCRRVHECDERKAFIRATAEAIQSPVDGPDGLAELWDRSRLLKQALESYEKAIDLLIDEHGTLPLPDEREIIRATKTRMTIDARSAWPVMQQAGLDAEEINSTLTVSKTKLLAAVAARVEKRNKTSAKADIITALDVAGAIGRTTSSYRRVVKRQATESDK